MVPADQLKKESVRRMKSSSELGEVVEEVAVAGRGGEEEEDDLVLPGFRFHPTDEELVTFYLRRKVAGKRLSIEIIKEMDIYKHDPWDFPKASTAGGEKEWYFFCLRGRKYRNSIRPNRVTGSGFWKATGIDRPVCSGGGGGSCIGLKKSLVYYRGSAGKGTKTDWMMHEFRLPPPSDAASTSPPASLQEAEVWTICRIFRRNITYKKHPQQHQAAAAAATIAPPDSSSMTGSLETTSDSTGEEHVNFLQPQQAPLNNGYYSHPQQHHGQYWSGAPPQPSPPAMAAFRQAGVLSPPMAAAIDPYSYRHDGCWDDISRMVMELSDPSVLSCDYRYA